MLDLLACACPGIQQFVRRMSAPAHEMILPPYSKQCHAHILHSLVKLS